MKSITVTTHSTGGLELQDPFPAEGRLVVDVAASTTKVFTATTAQYNRLRPQLDAAVSAGIITALLVNETEEERTDKFLESKHAAKPSVRTGFGKFFVSDGTGGLIAGSPYFLKADGTVLDLGMSGSSPYIYMGTIAAAADFPTLAAVVVGHSYLITADCIDDDATKTNTGQNFLTGSMILWDGVAWVDNDPQETGIVTVFATPYVVADGIHTVLVQTGVIAAPSVVTLPTALALRVGRKIQIIDQDGAAATYPISVTPQGADEIDNVAAAYVIAANDGAVQVTCVSVGNYYSGPDAEITKRLADIGAGRSQMDSRQVVASTETLRLFRALAAGKILRASAETGVVAAAGESMTFDVEIAGTSCLTGVITVDDTTVIDTPVVGVVDSAAQAFVAGDLIRVVRTYVPGGGATPMANTVVDVELQFD